MASTQRPTVNGQKLETVTNFKYLGSVITDEGSKPEILSTIAQATAALTRLKPAARCTEKKKKEEEEEARTVQQQ